MQVGIDDQSGKEQSQRGKLAVKESLP